MDKITLPGFLEELSNVTQNYTNDIAESPATIQAIVVILQNIAGTASNYSITISENSTKVGNFVLRFTFSKNICLESNFTFFFFNIAYPGNYRGSYC